MVKKFRLLKLNRIYIFFMFFSFLNLYAEDKSILWLTNSRKDVEEIVEFKRLNSLNFSFSLVCDVFNDTTTYIEQVDNFYNYFPVNYVFFPAESAIALIKNYGDHKGFFSDFFDEYCNENGCDKKGFFSLFPVVNEEMISTLKRHNYNWVYGGKSDKSYYENIDGMNVVFFKPLKNIEDIEKSTDVFFIVDDISTSTSSVNLLKSVFLNRNINFLSVSNLLSISTHSISLSSSNYNTTYKPQDFLNLPFFLNCQGALNYISYLYLVSDFIGPDRLKDKRIVKEYFNLLDYFGDICNEPDIDEIRRTTKQIFILLDEEAPYFVYTDFLKNPPVKKYQRTISDNKAYYLSISSSSTISSFDITGDENGYLFSIYFSTDINFNEVDIYVDINKRRNAGIGYSIKQQEKIDSLYWWEYAFIIDLKSKKLEIYKPASGYRDVLKVKTQHFNIDGRRIYFHIDKKDLYGNVVKWNYIVCVYKDTLIDGIYDMVGDFLVAVQ